MSLNGNRRSFALMVVAFSMPMGAAYADDEDKATLQKYTQPGTHRLDLSYTRIDAVEADIDLVLFGYTGALRPNIRIGITGGMAWIDAPADVDAGRDMDIDESGIADTQVTFQYDPNSRLTASPWVPDTAGINASLTMPTGDAKKGLTGDTWRGSVGVGWPVDFIADIWLIPAIGYEFTFAEGAAAVPDERVYVTCAIIWLFPFGGWIGYGPTFTREFKTDQWIDDHTLTIGKMWRSGFGISLDISQNDRIDRITVRDDRIWLFNTYYQF
jgi:hypothetical protein